MESRLKESLRRIIRESIRLEAKVGRLYMLFSRTLPEDRSFWWELALEEGHHASLLKSAQSSFLDEGLFPTEVFDTAADTLLSIIEELDGAITRFERTSPARAEALELGYRLETSAIESCYQRVCETTVDTEAHRLFRELNQENQDHSRRIAAYRREIGI